MTQSNRSISLPVAINQRDGLVEDLVVHEKGKTHESLFRTTVRPQDLHLAALLLAETNQPAAFTNQVQWRLWHATREGLETYRPEDFVQTNRQVSSTQIRLEWQYRTPIMNAGKMAAEEDGSIASLIRDERSLVQNVGPGSENDEIWWVKTNLWPRLTGPLRLELLLLEAKPKAR